MKKIDIRDIKGFRIGHATDIEGATGCTAIICENGGVAGVDIRGGAPATRETAVLNPENMIEKIHCIILSGGSAYGLDASSGAMKYLEEKKIGFQTGAGIVPIVCGASLFDLAIGDSSIRPDKEMGYRACINSERNLLEEGNIGAGTGATVGKLLGKDYSMKSGLGIYAAEIGNLKIGAIVALNALGDILDSSGNIIAGLLSEDKESFRNTSEVMKDSLKKDQSIRMNMGNTTIGCIITNAKLNKTEANRLAKISHNGYVKSIEPVHTSLDGDAIFVFSSGEIEVNKDVLSNIAVEIIGKSVRRAVKKAKTAYGIKGLS